MIPANPRPGPGSMTAPARQTCFQTLLGLLTIRPGLSRPPSESPVSCLAGFLPIGLSPLSLAARRRQEGTVTLRERMESFVWNQALGHRQPVMRCFDHVRRDPETHQFSNSARLQDRLSGRASTPAPKMGYAFFWHGSVQNGATVSPLVLVQPNA